MVSLLSLLVISLIVLIVALPFRKGTQGIFAPFGNGTCRPPKAAEFNSLSSRSSEDKSIELPPNLRPAKVGDLVIGIRQRKREQC